MAILDRFRTLPRHKHPDPAVRLAYVAELPIDDREQLAAIARGDDDPHVRRAAVAKLLDPPVLAGVAREDRDEAVRDQAIAMLRDIALEAFEGVTEAESLAAVAALTDVQTLAAIANPADVAHVERVPVVSGPDRAVEYDHRVAHDEAAAARVRADEEQRERERAEAAGLRADQEAEERARADEAAHKQIARRQARLAELADEADAAAADADFGAARRRLQVARREWKDLSAGIDIDPAAAARFAEAETRLAARDAELQEQDARRRHDALAKLVQLAGRLESLLARPALTFK